MALEWNYTTGSFAAVERAARRALGQYLGGAKRVKVGRTNDPERRHREHQRDRRLAGEKPWKRMIVLHETDRFIEAVQAEKALIDWLKSRRVRPEIESKLGNRRGGDYVAESELHFVYLLLDALGEPVDEPEWLYSTGHFSTIATGLKQALAVYARLNDYIKIGRTNDAERRWREHQNERRKVNDSWQRMVIIYVTGSFKYAAMAEHELIMHARNAGYRAEHWNDASGSDKPRPQTNYIYVLME